MKVIYEKAIEVNIDLKLNVDEQKKFGNHSCQNRHEKEEGCVYDMLFKNLQ